MAEHVDDHIETVRVRRAPKMSVFLLLGAALGVFVAMILTFAFDGSDQASPNTGFVYSQMQVFGFVTLICVPIGIALFGFIAVMLDRRASRHARDVVVDHETVRGESE
ncbi:potassium transporter Trk [Microbacterium sp. NPDC076911]|uniref:potassium transporter Trk n=1 Tax=Microbacterium sp. NPDC076911 TaxID=3154958 RepID=UPI00341EEE17